MRKVLREEKKFLLSDFEYRKNACLLENVLLPDEHNGMDGYLVRSLYFDTIDNQDYADKLDGVENRKKIRLRVYNPESEIAYLEIKQKEGKYQTKRSLELKKKDALELIKGNYQVLLQYENDFAKECYILMTGNGYVPKTIVEYKRLAFVAKENSIRLTFDSHIMSTETNFNLFDKNLPMYSVFPLENVVFEVKYNGFLLSYIKNVMDSIEKSELSVSKYCLARQVSLGYVY